MEMKKILIIGDICTDIFQYGTCERICPEAPVPIFKLTYQNKKKGMAYNVYENIISLGIDALIMGKDRPTKIRYIDEVSNQMLIRIDEYDDNDRIDIKSFDMLNLYEYDGVIISDYDKGFLTASDITFIGNKCKISKIPSFLDTKKKITTSMIENIDFIKINEKEYKENYGALQYKGHLIVTLGKRGADIHNLVSKPTITNIPIEDEHPVIDLSGAGDTFLAAFVVEYLKNNNVGEGVKFANKCASWVVTQKGVVAIDLNEIIY